MTRFRNALLGPFLIVLSAQVPPAGQADEPPLFEDGVQRLMKTKCGKCHSTDAKKGGLDLSNMTGLRRGGESGDSVIAESANDSLLWQMVDGGGMPPEGEPQLSKTEKQRIHEWLAAGAKSKTPDVAEVTQHEFLPFLYARCVVCHGRRKQEGGLDLRSVASILKGGKSGPAVSPGKPESSLLLKRVHAKDMPPPKELIRAGVRPLEPSEIELITQWIEQGAKEFEAKPDVQTTEPDTVVTGEDRKFWSFQPPKKPEVPHVERSETSIDAFLFRKLQERDLEFSPVADRRTLIRRIAFGLTGLPPDWQDVERFVADPSADWHAKVVDFYLESPRYGEHWARYWLDLCGYADSEGKRSADPVRPNAWRYRDYVIRAMNDDKPYDRFLLEQIAGDELYDYESAERVTPEMRDALVATGFLRMAPDGTGSDIVDTVEERFEVVADEIEILGSAVMGLTLKCAQCHTHKYDPIPHRDYYRLVAVFQGAYDVYDWLKPTSVKGQSKRTNIVRRYLPHVTSSERDEWAAAKQVIQDKIDKLQAELKQKTKTLGNDHADVEKLKKTTDKRVKELNASMPPEPLIRALWDRGEPSPTWIFRRGEFSNPGDWVGPGVPSVLTDGRTPFTPRPMRDGSTGRRLAFAQWLTDAKQPLTARVIVNRVWEHHFGRGIVQTAANFGKTGTRPTHPELLDWLAVSFVENGWSLKWLHRQLLATRAYRQSSQQRAESTDRDSDNRWLSRMPLRRLRAEAVRDSLLAVSGKLDEERFGRPDQVTVRADGLVTSKPGEKGWRRTIYVQQRRKELPTILETFDLPQMIPNCVARPNSTVAPQALHLLNNGMVRELAAAFAAKVRTAHPDSLKRQIEAVYHTALSREPTAAEQRHAMTTIEALTKHWKSVRNDEQDKPADELALANFCHVIMNSAGFLFVD